MTADHHQSMYADQYGTDQARARKRAITAVQTIDHIDALVGTGPLGRVCDVGAGEGSVVAALARDPRVSKLTAFEISASGLDVIRARDLPNVEVLAFDGYHAPCEDKAFDLALSAHVLEHVEHERQFLHEIKRISHRCVIEVPLEHTPLMPRDLSKGDASGHINHYTSETFARLLQTSGMRVVRMDVQTHSLAYAQLEGRIKGIVKHTIRYGLLRTMPRVARAAMVYVATALCDCD